MMQLPACVYEIFIFLYPASPTQNGVLFFLHILSPRTECAIGRNRFFLLDFVIRSPLFPLFRRLIPFRQYLITFPTIFDHRSVLSRAGYVT